MNKQDIIKNLILYKKDNSSIKDSLVYLKEVFNSKSVYLFYPTSENEMHCVCHSEEVDSTFCITKNELSLLMGYQLDKMIHLKHKQNKIDIMNLFLSFHEFVQCRFFIHDKDYCNGLIVIVDEKNECILEAVEDLIDCIFITYQEQIKYTMLKQKTDLITQDVHIDKLLLDTLHNLLISTNLSVTIDEMLAKLTNYYNATRTLIFEYIDKNQHISITHEHCKDNVQCIKSSYRATPVNDPYWKDILLHYNGVYIHNEDALHIMVMPFSSLESKGFFIVINPMEHCQEHAFLQSIVHYTILAFDKRNTLNRLNHLSYVDDITGLFNRNRYYDYIDKVKRITPLSMGVLFIDINHLKLMNDTLGHVYGDRLIEWTALILKKHLNKMIFRIGGDEFVCFMENITYDDFMVYVHSLNKAVNQYNHRYLSIGAVFKVGFDSIEQLINEADELMYADKMNDKDYRSYSKNKVVRLLKRQMKEINKTLW